MEDGRGEAQGQERAPNAAGGEKAPAEPRSCELRAADSRVVAQQQAAGATKRPIWVAPRRQEEAGQHARSQHWHVGRLLGRQVPQEEVRGGCRAASTTASPWISRLPASVANRGAGGGQRAAPGAPGAARRNPGLQTPVGRSSLTWASGSCRGLGEDGRTAWRGASGPLPLLGPEPCAQPSLAHP